MVQGLLQLSTAASVLIQVPELEILQHVALLTQELPGSLVMTQVCSMISQCPLAVLTVAAAISPVRNKHFGPKIKTQNLCQPQLDLRSTLA